MTRYFVSIADHVDPPYYVVTSPDYRVHRRFHDRAAAEAEAARMNATPSHQEQPR